MIRDLIENSISQVAPPVFWERKRFPQWYKASELVSPVQNSVSVDQSKEVFKTDNPGKSTPIKEAVPKAFQDDLAQDEISKDAPKKVKDSKAK